MCILECWMLCVTIFSYKICCCLIDKINNCWDIWFCWYHRWPFGKKGLPIFFTIYHPYALIVSISNLKISHDNEANLWQNRRECESLWLGDMQSQAISILSINWKPQHVFDSLGLMITQKQANFINLMPPACFVKDFLDFFVFSTSINSCEWTNHKSDSEKVTL